MKIRYEFINGDIVIVEVDDELGEWILASRRRESADDKRHRRHCYSLDTISDKSRWIASRSYIPSDMMDRFIENLEAEQSRKDKRARLYEALDSLTEKERELMEAIIFQGKTQAVFARENGLDKGMISRRYKAAMKKIKKYF